MHTALSFIVTMLVVGSAFGVENTDWRTVFTKGKFLLGDTALPYRMAEVGDPGDGPRPLVLFLHGAGERGADNEAQLKHGMKDLVAWCVEQKRSCVIVAPQCPKGSWWEDSGGNYKDPEALRFPEKPGPNLSAVLALTDDIVKTKKLDSKRLYLTGLSMGGYGSFAAINQRPEFFAAAMPVCGGGDLTKAAKIKNLPLWIFHGDADRVVPVALSREMVKALKAAGGTPKYTEYPGVGHNSWSATYSNAKVWAWLFAQKR